MKRLLDAVVEGGREVDDYPFKFSPFEQQRMPLLFPFLVLESKQEASSADDHAILLQSAFAIRTLLKLQNNLRCITGKESQWMTGGPFVWFLSHKGASWDVAGAYTHYKKNHPLDDPEYVGPTIGCWHSLTITSHSPVVEWQNQEQHRCSPSPSHRRLYRGLGQGRVSERHH